MEGFLFHFGWASHTQPPLWIHIHTHNPSLLQTYWYKDVLTHTQLQSMKDIIADKKDLEEMQKTVVSSIVAQLPLWIAIIHTVFSTRHVSSSLISVNTMCMSSVDAARVYLLCPSTSNLPHTPSLSTCCVLTTAKWHFLTYSDYKISLDSHSLSYSDRTPPPLSRHVYNIYDS